MNFLSNVASISTTCTQPISHPNSSLEYMAGTVVLFDSHGFWVNAEWISDAENCLKPAYYMGSYPELFKGKGDFVLCLNTRVFSAESDNWEAWPVDKKTVFPSGLPIHYFFGKKEGDIIELICNEKKKRFSITCKQKDCKYGNMPFEDMVEYIFMETYNKLNATYQKNGLSENELKQWRIINDIKRTQYPHSTISKRIMPGQLDNCKIPKFDSSCSIQ